MPLEFDIADFYRESDFAVTAGYSPAGGGTAVSVLGIFDTDYVEPFSAVESKQVAFRTWLGQFAQRPTKGATLTINSTTWRVKNVQDVPPNAQEVRLILEVA